MVNDYKYGTASFVMPHWRKDNGLSKVHLEEAICSVELQTDSNWNIIIIDDCSTCHEAIDYLDILKERLKDKLIVIKTKKNLGSGIARNVGIEWAYQHNSPIILFLDADDISHPKRLEMVRKHFMINPKTNVVYSTFQVIDEYGKRVEDKDIALSIREIMEGHKVSVVQGENAWIKIATEKNYTNLTSATAVRTDLAYETPFPDVRVSEDAHTWLRYGAHKGEFIYEPSIPSLYRIPTSTESASRERLENFCARKIKVDTDGFMEAFNIALKNGNVKEEDRKELLVRFYIKLAESISLAGAAQQKEELLKKSREIHPDLWENLARKKGLI